jgi:hypothetical protein
VTKRGAQRHDEADTVERGGCYGHRMSWAPPKPCVRAENSMTYLADMGVGKIAGIQLNQATGKLKTVFVLDHMSTTAADDRHQRQAPARADEYEEECPS